MAMPEKVYEGQDILIQNMLGIYEALAKGDTVTDICKRLGVSRMTWYYLAKKNRNFAEMIAAAELSTTDKVRRSLVDKCQQREVVKQKVLPSGKVVKYIDVVEADFNAIKFYLLNRDSENWSDKQQVEITNTKVVVDIIEDAEYQIIKEEDETPVLPSTTEE
jgi:hypothetical protein